MLIHLIDSELRIFEDGITEVLIPNRVPVGGAISGSLVARLRRRARVAHANTWDTSRIPGRVRTGFHQIVQRYQRSRAVM